MGVVVLVTNTQTYKQSCKGLCAHISSALYAFTIIINIILIMSYRLHKHFNGCATCSSGQFQHSRHSMLPEYTTQARSYEAVYPQTEMFRSCIQRLFVQLLTQVFFQVQLIYKLTLIVVKPHFNKPVMLESNKNRVPLKLILGFYYAQLIKNSLPIGVHWQLFVHVQVD